MKKYLPADAFPKRSNIQNFNFRRNEISSIHENAFLSQNKLQYLTLSSNKLQVWGSISTTLKNSLNFWVESFEPWNTENTEESCK